MKDDPKGVDSFRDDISPISLIGARREDFGFGRKRTQPPRPPARLLDVSRATLNVSKKWLVKGIFAEREHTRIIAPPMHMKSALIGSAANHLAAGAGDWHGYKIKQRAGVLYFALERPDLVLRRLIIEQELMGWHELKLPIKVCPDRLPLASREDVKHWIDIINRASDEIGEQVKFLPIDTWGKLISAGEGDEQQAKDNNIVCGYLGDVREATGVHTAVIGHMGKDPSKGERGSNAPKGDADTVAAISGGEGIFKLTVTEANDLSSGPLFSFRSRKCVYEIDEDGEEKDVWIVDPDSDPSTDETVSPSPYEKVKMTENRQAAFTLLYDAGSKGLTLDEWSKQATEEAGLAKTTFFNVRKWLLSKKLVREYNGTWHVDHKS
jgi:hypothetical protein